MKKSRLSEVRIMEVLRQLEAGRKVSELSREYGVSTASIYVWKSKTAGLQVSQLKRHRELEEEYRRLKTLVTDLSLDKVALKSVIEKTEDQGNFDIEVQLCILLICYQASGVVAASIFCLNILRKVSSSSGR